MSTEPQNKRLVIEQILIEYIGAADAASATFNAAISRSSASASPSSPEFYDFVRRRANAMIDATNKLMEL